VGGGKDQGKFTGMKYHEKDVEKGNGRKEESRCEGREEKGMWRKGRGGRKTDEKREIRREE
jgi:hypothetical protein